MFRLTIAQKYWDKIPVSERPEVQTYLRKLETKLYKDEIEPTKKILLKCEGKAIESVLGQKNSLLDYLKFKEVE